RASRVIETPNSVLGSGMRHFEARVREGETFSEGDTSVREVDEVANLRVPPFGHVWNLLGSVVQGRTAPSSLATRNGPLRGRSRRTSVGLDQELSRALLHRRPRLCGFLLQTRLGLGPPREARECNRSHPSCECPLGTSGPASLPFVP